MRERRERDPKRIARRAEVARRLAAGVKFCRGCQTEFPFASFAKCSESPDGLDARCKDCNNRYMRELYASDLESWREKSREKSRKIRRSEARLEYERKWRAENADRLREGYRTRMAANPIKEREKWLLRRARVTGARVGGVDLDLLWVRHCGICALCEHPIDRSVAWPNPESKSVDHVIPLARGGAHEQGNLTWTHLFCNLSKGARLPGSSRAEVA
jgi:5-methylcytosine-specific restriction endonuclease McrA